MNKTAPYLRLSYSAILIALAVGLGYALAWIPNVELVSFTCVLAGYILGAGWGMFVGGIALMLYSFLSPFGMAPPPVWIAQGIGGASLALAGAIFSTKMKKPIYAMAVGIAATIFYDILTNAAGFFAFPTKSTFIVYLFSGFAFAVVHIIANGAIFAVLFPLLGNRIEKFRGKMYSMVN